MSDQESPPQFDECEVTVVLVTGAVVEVPFRKNAVVTALSWTERFSGTQHECVVELTSLDWAREHQPPVTLDTDPVSDSPSGTTATLCVPGTPHSRGR
jgi:hypothetical protein